MEEKIHDYDRRLSNLQQRIKTCPELAINRSVILGFMDDCLIQGLSKGRAVKYGYYLLRLDKWLGKDFKKATKEDIKRLVKEIEISSYAPLSKLEFKVTIRRFYMWLHDTDEYPDIVKWVKVRSSGANKTRLPEQLLTRDDVMKMIQASSNPRYRALISVLYETGARIGELLFLRLRSIVFDKHGGVISIPPFGKTGARRVRIVSSVPYLQEWFNKHPDKDNPDAYLWIRSAGKDPKYPAVARMIKRLAKEVGIRKPVNPHAFRHARATHVAGDLTEAQMKQYFGWTQSSRMAAIYVHLSGRDVDDAILRLHGIKDEEKKEKDKMSPKVCARCELKNPATNSMCSKCGLPLDEKAATEAIKADLEKQKAGGLLDKLLKDEEFRNLMRKKMGELPDEK